MIIRFLLGVFVAYVLIMILLAIAGLIWEAMNGATEDSTEEEGGK